MPGVTSPPAEGPGPRLNATAAALLGLLLEKEMTGWDLIAAAQERIGEFWSLTQSQVYRELAAMAERGLVSAGPPGPRERKPYAVTPAGRSAFAEWLDGEPGADQVRIPLLLTIAFAGHLPPGRLGEIVDAQRAVHAERLARYRAAQEQLAGARTVDPARLATLEFGLRHEQAVLDWFAALPGILAPRP
jgi:DNA-binding PadR family transcriptional regulator